MSGARVVAEVDIAAPPERVWGALSEPADLLAWHGWWYPELEEEIDELFLAGAAERRAGELLDTGDGRFELQESGEGSTRVRITRSGGAEIEPVDQGWATFARQLAFYLERHPGAERRTLYIAGLRRDDSPPSVTALSSVPPESLLFAVDGQIGTPTGGGAGIAILTDRWMCREIEVGMIVSAYGLDADRFAALADRWRDRFYRRFEPVEDVQGPPGSG